MKFQTLVIIITLILAVGIINFKNINKQEFVCTVNEKTVKNDRNNSRYLIFTDSEVFENSDMWLRLKFNSSDLYSEIKVGETYKFTTVGFRVPMLSMYRNIIKVEKIK